MLAIPSRSSVSNFYSGAEVNFSKDKVSDLQKLVVTFYIHSIVDIYGSVKRISPGAKGQMLLDIQSLLLSCKNFVNQDLSSLEHYYQKFFELVTYDEPTALSNLVSNLSVYPLRLLKHFYLFASKDNYQRKSVISSNYVVKTEKMVTLFELSRSCLISLVEDQKVIEDSHYSDVLVELVTHCSQEAKKVNRLN